MMSRSTALIRSRFGNHAGLGRLLALLLAAVPLSLATACDDGPVADAGDGDVGDGDGDGDGDTGDGDGDSGDGDGDGDTGDGDGDGDGDTGDGGVIVPPADAGPDPADAGDGDGDGDPDGGPADGGEDPNDGGAPTDGGPIDVDAGGDPSITVCDVAELLFEARCTSCHDGNYQFDLRADAVQSNLVDVESTLYPGNTLIVPGNLSESLLYRKVAEDLTGAGVGAIMPPGSTLNMGELDILEDWILGGANTTCEQVEVTQYVPLSPEAHLRRVATALKGERPTASELAAVRADPAAVEDIIDDYMTTQAFGETIRDLHNDTMLVRTTLLFQLLFPAIDELATLATNDPTYVDARRINVEVMEAPLRTAEYIVATDRPYTELVTGDYMIGTPATEAIWGNGSVATTTWYGGYPGTAQTGSQYDHSEDPYGVGAAEDFDVYNWVDGRGTAGVITSNAFLSRWQSAGANYNRGRANAISKAFLCYDYLSNPVDVSSEGGVDLSDPNAVNNAVSDPTTSCWGCHATLDPLATYLQPFRPIYFSGIIGTDGYPFAMNHSLFAHDGALGSFYSNGREPGYFSATAMDPNPTPVDVSGDGKVNATDLGQHMAADPRFTTCAVKRFHSFFTQSELHDIPAARLAELEGVLTNSNYSAKELIKAIMLSDVFRASHTVDESGSEDFNGILRIRPSQAARLVRDATGVELIFPVDFQLNLLDDTLYPGEITLPYGQVDYLRDDFIGFRELGGGVDSFTVTRPVRTFTGGTGAAYRWIGNFGGFFMVAVEQGTPLPSRMLMTAADFVTETDEASVRDLLVELHLKLYGIEVLPDSGAVDDAYDLWSGLFAIHADPVRAWTHVVSSMVQDVRFSSY